jgi:hypothetical protein
MATNGVTRKARFAVLGAFLVLLLTTAPGNGESGRIPVLLVGLQRSLDIASIWLEADPLTVAAQVPARTYGSEHMSAFSADDIRRFVRIYLPRTLEDMAQHSFIFLAEPDLRFFAVDQIQLMYTSIAEEGTGALNTRSVMSHSSSISSAWATSRLSDAFPNDAQAVISTGDWLVVSPMKIVVDDSPDLPPVLKPFKNLGVEASFQSYENSLLIPREGSRVFSWSRGSFPGLVPGDLIPHTVSWEYDGGITWSLADMLGKYWSLDVSPYAPDMVLNLIMFSVGKDVPTSAVEAHRLRESFAELHSGVANALAFIRFAGHHGASSSQADRELGRVLDLARESKRLYVEGSLKASGALMLEAQGILASIQEKAVRRKNQALIWTHFLEYCAVTVTILTSVSVVFGLMRGGSRRGIVTELRPPGPAEAS